MYVLTSQDEVRASIRRYAPRSTPSGGMEILTFHPGVISGVGKGIIGMLDETCDLRRLY